MLWEKRKDTKGREKPFVPCRSRRIEHSSLCKDLFFTEGRGALWLYIMFVSPHLRRCISGDLAADCALCIQRKETSWMPFPPTSTHRRAEVRADRHCSAQRCRKTWPFPRKTALKREIQSAAWKPGCFPHFQVHKPGWKVLQVSC